MDWELRAGDNIARVDLHKRYGGSRQGGISPSAQTPNVFIFSDASIGEQYGYFDDWHVDGLFHYTGEGQKGDQRMRAGNLAIARHGEDGRALRVFRGVRGEVEYVGEFEVDAANPFYRSDAPGKDGLVREVIVFRLRPLNVTAPDSRSKIDRLPSSLISEVAVEAQNAESAFVNPPSEGWEITRREQRLVLAYKAFLEAKGSSIVRYMMRPEGEAKPLFCDLYDKTRNNLVEAKGSAARESVRMAIGQLADYSRFVDPKPQLAVLFPARPRKDLEALLLSQGMHAVWQADEGKFEDNKSGEFT